MVEQVRQVAMEGDYERAHSIEDDIYYKALLAISVGERNPIEIAETALKAEQLDFPRWAA